MNPLATLSLAVHSNPGAYAVLVASGVSVGAGVPTGWGVVTDLISKLALLEGVDAGDDLAVWYRDRYGEEPDYSRLLDALAKTPAEHGMLMRGYFEPTPEERQRGVKVPSAAHRALAELAAGGYIRVFLTTNFDRMLELALEEAGVAPTVISTPDSLRGAAPTIRRCRRTSSRAPWNRFTTRGSNSPAGHIRSQSISDGTLTMIIDCHGHYTTAPQALKDYRAAQVAGLDDPGYKPLPADLGITDDEIRESLEGAQLRLQRERGTDLTIFSPRAAGMAHQNGNEVTNRYWTEICNDMIHRACSLYPEKFVGVCQLPQVPGVSPENCIPELERCVNELGFIGLNLNPDPTGGYWTDPPLIDRWWYPLYEKMCELDVPAMIHVSSSCNPNFHFTGAHYICGDTTAFMQLITADLFKDFPTLKFIIPHGGGAVPFHWGRYRGLAQDMGKPPLDELLLDNVFFDTCVYHQPGIDLMTRVIPIKNILFASEMVGAVRGIDPETGFPFDDTKRYVDGAPDLSDAERTMIFEGNVRNVFSRLKA